MARARTAGISGVAVLLGSLGLYFVYAGIEDVPVVDGLRDILRGRNPQGRAQSTGLSRFWAAIAAPAGTVEGDPAAFPSGPGAGQIVDASGIRVDSSIARQVSALVAEARRDGATLGGYGYRSHQEQINLRRQNCGTSQYAIYEMPSSRCSPPTARPGHSMHERGLAVDFTWNGRLVQKGTFGFAWLALHAPLHGLRNLPSEPWHWSTSGT